MSKISITLGRLKAKIKKDEWFWREVLGCLASIIVLMLAFIAILFISIGEV